MQKFCNNSLIRILLADDHPVVLSALEAVFNKSRGFKVIGSATSGKDLLTILANNEVDLVITDFFMPNSELGYGREDGLSMLGGIRCAFPKVCLIVFTMLTNSVILSKIKELGVNGIVGKDETETVLVEICMSMSMSKINSETILSPGVSERINILDEEGDRSLSRLSKRELEVLRMYASGLPLTDIAKKLNRALTTVATQKNSAMKKLKITSNTDVIRYASDIGLV